MRTYSEQPHRTDHLSRVTQGGAETPTRVAAEVAPRSRHTAATTAANEIERRIAAWVVDVALQSRTER